MRNFIILVDDNDKVVGKEDKLLTHKNGLQHRAFSVLIINDKNQMLIHKRNSAKYHSGSLWTNACCSHPVHEEDLIEAAHRRLKEEMGFNCPLKEVFSFKYYYKFDNGLVENEYDHVFVGLYNSNLVHPDPTEVESYKWIDYDLLLEDVENNNEEYTVWFKKIIKRLVQDKIDIFEVF